MILFVKFVTSVTYNHQNLVNHLQLLECSLCYWWEPSTYRFCIWACVPASCWSCVCGIVLYEQVWSTPRFLLQLCVCRTLPSSCWSYCVCRTNPFNDYAIMLKFFLILELLFFYDCALSRERSAWGEAWVPQPPFQKKKRKEKEVNSLSGLGSSVLTFVFYSIHSGHTPENNRQGCKAENMLVIGLILTCWWCYGCIHQLHLPL